MILILSENFDASTNKVIDWIRFFGSKVIRVNETDLFDSVTIEMPDNEKEIEFLKSYVLEIRSYLKSSKNELPLITENHVFGAMQTNFNELQKNLKNYDEQIKNTYNTSKISNLKKKKQQYQILIAISIKQLALIKQKLINAEDKYLANTNLLK